MKMLKRVYNSEIKSIDVANRTLTAYVSTAARDRMNESLLPEGADLKMFKKNPVVLFAHDYRQLPIAKALWIKKDADGLISKMQFRDAPFAQEVFNMYKDGFMKAFSVGFIPREHINGDGKKEPHTTYTKWELLEYSAVPVPANPEALALAMQKGILKSEGLKNSFTDEKYKWVKEPEEEVTEEEVTEEEVTEEIVEEKEELPDHILTCPECELPIDVTDLLKEKESNPNPELLDQIKELKAEIFRMKDTIINLRYDLIQANKKNKEKSPLEMTDSEIAKKIEDITIGVIRGITGKVN